jgi:hypothetical protein
MAIDFFDIENGLQLDGGRVVINVTGAPGGTTASDNAGIGSLALSDNGTVYRKSTAGSGADTWSNIASGEYWLDPALVKDDTTYANLAAAETAMNGGTVDGITVADGDRILYTDITGSNKNVFIVTGTPGAGATLTEDTNIVQDGDQIYIQDGTNAGNTYAYNGTDWVQNGGTSSTELGFIRAFIGKDAAGSELPNYTSTQVVTQNGSLEAAIGELDAVANVPAVQLGVTGGTTVTLDSVLVDDIAAATWKVYAQETATQDTRVSIITAAHDGNTGNDAATVKHNNSAILKLGTVNGFNVDVDLNLTGASQEMRLRVSATNDCDFRCVREEYIDLSIT